MGRKYVMDNSLTFLYIVFFFSIILLISSLVLTLMFIFPLQIKQANVKNGLLKLRKQLLTWGVFTIIITIVSIFSLTMRYLIKDVDILRYMITTMIFLFSLGMFVQSLIFYRIYHQEYTSENKKHHAIIDRLEKAEVKRENKRKS